MRKIDKITIIKTQTNPNSYNKSRRIRQEEPIKLKKITQIVTKK